MDVCNKVFEILKELSNQDTITNDSRLLQDLALDSLSMVMLLLQIEEAFEIELDESDMNPNDLETVSQVIDLVSKYVEGKNEENN